MELDPPSSAVAQDSRSSLRFSHCARFGTFMGWLTPWPSESYLYKPLMDQLYHRWVTRHWKVSQASTESRNTLWLNWLPFSKKSVSFSHDSLHEIITLYSQTLHAYMDYMDSSKWVKLQAFHISQFCWHYKQYQQTLATLWLRNLTKAGLTLCIA